MQWSKLRSTVRSLICEELRDRVDFHVTSYRHSHDEAEKVWITVDGERVLTASWYQHQWFGWPRDAKGRLEHSSAFPKDLDKAGHEVHLPQALGNSLRAYVDLPFPEALQSADPVIRALCLIDRRLGKRGLAQIEVSEQDHSLVRTFYLLRVSAMKRSPVN